MLGRNIFGDDDAKDGRTSIGGHRAADPIDTAAFDMAALADLLFSSWALSIQSGANDVVGTSTLAVSFIKILGQAFNQLAVAPYLCFCFQSPFVRRRMGRNPMTSPTKAATVVMRPLCLA